SGACSKAGVVVASQFCLSSVMLFFFQAEDGIRDWSVTGVQTCALPIYSAAPRRREAGRPLEAGAGSPVQGGGWLRGDPPPRVRKIGRASCRERVEISVVGGSLKKKQSLQLDKVTDVRTGMTEIGVSAVR